jgi:alpha-D-xyloside xylohydrolase
VTRRTFTAAAAGASGLFAQGSGRNRNWQLIYPGIWRLSLGAPEKLTPISIRDSKPSEQGLSALPHVASCPVDISDVRSRATRRGYVVSLPLAAGELVYGLGLQLLSFIQRGTKKTLRVNADPRLDSGDSHAPVPLYVTTRGYGVLIDTARYAAFYCGNKVEKSAHGPERQVTPEQNATIAERGLPPAYFRSGYGLAARMIVNIPSAQGVDVYVFGGPDMLNAVQRYNLFSGGGCLPARWGLGFWYRCWGGSDQNRVMHFADELRSDRIPCDVLGLEPGWQSHSYSCSFTWSDKFPNPAAMISELDRNAFRVNLWEHAFTHPTSPIYNDLVPRSGDYQVWGGVVPDFLDPAARRIFAAFHEKEHVALGVSGYKLDECDNSDYTGGWSFPEFSSFPSGPDGEQMHSFFGIKYQETIQSVFDRRRMRTFGLVRSSHALAAAKPYVLYSDLYDHKQFIRGVVNCGFSGLLWCPEVRDAASGEDLIRRLQTVVLSPLAMINAWNIEQQPWKLIRDAEGLVEACRSIIELRMRLVPYLYTAFFRYREEGVPPFRALVMDYASDVRTWQIDDQWLIGDRLLAAPVVAGVRRRDIYLPAGEWVDFWTGERHAGGRVISYDVPLRVAPLFVKSGSILPLAEVTLNTRDTLSRMLTVRVYGDGALPITLIEDDGESLDGPHNRLELGPHRERRTGTADVPPYVVKDWVEV